MSYLCRPVRQPPLPPSPARLLPIPVPLACSTAPCSVAFRSSSSILFPVGSTRRIAGSLPSPPLRHLWQNGSRWGAATPPCNICCDALPLEVFEHRCGKLYESLFLACYFTLESHQHARWRQRISCLHAKTTPADLLTTSVNQLKMVKLEKCQVGCAKTAKGPGSRICAYSGPTG